MAKSTSTKTKTKKAPVKKAVVKKAATKKVAAKKSAKKATPKKAVKTAKPKKEERTINIKYADKSAGQPKELIDIFENIKKMLIPYDKKRNFVLHMGTGGQANLVSHKPVVIAGRERKELWFVSALIQKGYVGFYYMPIYMNDPMRKQFRPEFLKCLKGKACFHLKKNDPLIMEDVKKAIKLGYEAYEQRGWI